jgi:hypothetical protein
LQPYRRFVPILFMQLPPYPGVDAEMKYKTSTA